jgi:hypothetical protein
MNALSQAQRDALNDYLSQNPKKCAKCGATSWDYGEIDVYAADVVSGSQEVEPLDGLTYVRVTCQSCGEEDAVDCREAGIDEPQT